MPEEARMQVPVPIVSGPHRGTVLSYRPSDIPDPLVYRDNIRMQKGAYRIRRFYLAGRAYRYYAVEGEPEPHAWEVAGFLIASQAIPFSLVTLDGIPGPALVPQGDSAKTTP